MLGALKKNKFEDLELAIATLIAFFLPLNQKFIVYLIALLVVLSVYGWVKRGVNKLDKSSWPFIFIFLIYLIGLIFTSNFDYGLKDIETRLTFVLFPVLFGLTKRERPLNLGWIIKALVLGLLIKIIICYYFAYECFEIFGYVECFEGSRLAYNIHPTYFAIYLILGGAFNLIYTFEKKEILFWRIFAVLIGLIFLFMVFRMFSLGPFVGLLVMIATLLFAYFYFKKKKLYFLVGAIILTIVGFLAIQNVPFLKADVLQVKEELAHFYEDREQYISDNQDSPHSINGRIIIWVASFDLVKKHPFGVGTGDYKDVLLANYRAGNMDAFADKELNSHCQYLQTSIAVGIVTALFLIGTFFYYCWLGFKYHNFYLIAMTSLFATVCLFESVLERQWGILFFMFFLSVLLTEKVEILENCE